MDTFHVSSEHTRRGGKIQRAGVVLPFLFSRLMLLLFPALSFFLSCFFHFFEFLILFFLSVFYWPLLLPSQLCPSFIQLYSMCIWLYSLRRLRDMPTRTKHSPTIFITLSHQSDRSRYVYKMVFLNTCSFLPRPLPSFPSLAVCLTVLQATGSWPRAWKWN